MKKQCGRCKEWKGVGCFSIRTNVKKDSLQATCKSCNKISCNDWYQKNKAKKIKTSNQYDNSNTLIDAYIVKRA